MACTEIEKIIDKFNVFVEKPVKFLAVQNDVKDDFKNLVKSLYDYTKIVEKNEKTEKKGALPELIVQDFDEEQIWQEIELQNNECWDHLVWEVANCISAKNDLIFPVKISKDSNEAVNDEADENSSAESEHSLLEHENDDFDATPKKKDTITSKTKIRPSIVDDKFFKLQEMENFLLKEEKNDGKQVGSDSEEEHIDMFEDNDGNDDDGDEGNVMYSEFFDQEYDAQSSEYYDEQEEDEHNNLPNSEIVPNDTKIQNKKDKKVRFAQSSDDDNVSDMNDITTDNPKWDKKTDFELRQQRLQQQIEKLEQKTLNEAPWQLKGEVNATKRPQNSLLEEVVDFDLTSRPAPIITEQTTVTLEDIIKLRIKDKAWDDVVRKEKPVDDQLKFHKKEVIDQSKSKLSLAQVYEAEYLKQKQALSGDVEEEKEHESHTEIRDAMKKLFSKLDALCHYHYTPKAAQAEVKIVSNTPAISMEEVAPVATSDATLLAPEEVKKKQKGDMMSKEERSQTDKNRERRKKKLIQRAKGKVMKVTEHRNTKKGMEVTDKSLKTSKAFFQQLNEDTSSLIKSNNSKRSVKNKGQ